MIRTSLYLSDADTLAHLQRIAARLGYMQTRGAGVGNMGSLGAMVKAIADGELVCVKREAWDALQDKAYPYDKD